MVSSVATHFSISKILQGHEAVIIKGGRRHSRLVIWFVVLVAVVALIFLVMRPEGEMKGNHHYTGVLRPKDAEQLHGSTESPSGKHATDDDDDQSKRETSRGFLVFTSGCKIPDLDPLDPAVRKYVKFYALDSDSHSGEEDGQEMTPDCSGKFGPALVESNLTSLFLVPSALSHYNLSKASEVHCCFRPYHRLTSDPKNYKSNCDDRSEYKKDCVPFGEDGTVSVGGEEFVRVECRNSSNSAEDKDAPTLYKDFHFFAPVELARKRAEEQREELNLTDATPVPREDKWNVLIIGPDAVSRLNFLRQMTETKQALEKIGAVELLGFNKVGDNTFPNVVGIMTGMPEEELKPICWPESKVKLDDCPWIWYNFTAAGYLTAMAEDCSWMSTFNYAKTGFLKQPVHYYLRPFAKVAEDENGHLKRMNAKTCVGPRLAVKMITGYVEKIVNTVKREEDPPPFFGHFWTNSLTHDYLNSAGYLDNPVTELIEKLEASGVLERTVLVFVSDHGMRWGGIRSTYQGRIEERLPIAYVALPKLMRQKYPSAAANLRRNARKRLTSPFDLYATMLDILNSEDRMTQEAVARRTKELPTSPPKGNETSELPRSMSLFLPIPEWRNCKIAGITPNWCCCHAGEKAMDKDDPLATEAAGVLVEKVNELVEVYPQCAKRNLVLLDLALVVESNPGSALFEASVRLVPVEVGGRGNTTFKMSVVGMISRVNRYGDQSACVDEFHAKLYCFCGS